MSHTSKKSPAASPAPGEELVNFAEHLADIARQIALRYFRNLQGIEYKHDETPVTIADREIEQALRQQVAKTYPSHGFTGEEFSARESASPWSWVVDPIDGTKSFATGKPTFGCLIAMLQEDRPVTGVIEMPALKERWLGTMGRVSTFCGQECATSQTRDLTDATLYATTIDMFSEGERELFDALSRQTRFRMFGADCYAYGLLASGHVDLVVEAGMATHDFLALVPVIQGAGGTITDWHGRALDCHSQGQILAAASPELHQRALAILSPVGCT